MQQASPDFGGIQLTPEDYAFMELVQSEVSESGQLPFDYPFNAMPKVIKKCAMFFYAESGDAVEERWYVIKREDALRDQKTQNCVVQLPDDIQSVYDVHQVDAGLLGPVSDFTRFFRNPMFMLGAINGSMSSSYGQSGFTSGPARRADMDMAFTESIARMSELQQFQTLFRKTVRFDFNQNTHKLNLMGSFDGHIVLSTFQRIPLADLYNDYRFLEYVTSSCLSRIGRILTTFEFQYPGEVSINFDRLEADGKNRMKEIEEAVKKDSDGSDLILIN